MSESVKKNPCEAPWKIRLKKAVEKSGKSHRELSLTARLNAGYVNDILKREDSKQPSFEKLLKIVDQLPISLSYIVYGFEMGPEEEKLLELFAKLNDDQKKAFLTLADSLADPSART